MIVENNTVKAFLTTDRFFKRLTPAYFDCTPLSNAEKGAVKKMTGRGSFVGFQLGCRSVRPVP